MITGLRQLGVCVCTLSILAVAAGDARASVIKVAAAGGAGVAFTQIAAAVASAADGDVILVETGSYKRFTIDDKSLVIHADVSASVSVTGTITIQNLAADKSVVLRGVDVPGVLSISFDALILDHDAGFVRIEDGTFLGAPGATDAFFHPTGYAGAVITDSASIAFDRCTLGGGSGSSLQAGSGTNGQGGVALQAAGSSVVIWDCTVFGGLGGGGGSKGGQGGSGGDGARLDGGVCFASGSQISGGNGGFAYNGGSGGDGLVLADAARATLLGGATQGGAASGGFGNPGLPGVPIDAAGGQLVTLDDTPRHFSATSPSREGDLIVFQFNGLPDETVFLLFALQSGQQPLGAAKGSLLLGSSFQRLVVGNTDGSGSRTLIQIAPELGPGVDALTVQCQALFMGTGGGPVLGGLSSELLLDASL